MFLECHLFMNEYIGIYIFFSTVNIKYVIIVNLQLIQWGHYISSYSPGVIKEVWKQVFSMKWDFPVFAYFVEHDLQTVFAYKTWESPNSLWHSTHLKNVPSLLFTSTKIMRTLQSANYIQLGQILYSSNFKSSIFLTWNNRVKLGTRIWTYTLFNRSIGYWSVWYTVASILL